MKKLFTIFLFAPYILFGQINTVPQEQSRINTMNEMMKLNTSSLMLYQHPSELKVSGSRYYFDEYLEGTLWLISGDSVKSKFKFDELENSIVILNTDGQEILLESDKISSCILVKEGKHIIYFKTFVPNDPGKKKIMQLLYSGTKYTLIKLPVKRLIPKTKVFHDEVQKHTFYASHRYYFKEGDNKYDEIKIKKSNLTSLFPNKKATIEKLLDSPAYKEGLNERTITLLLSELEKN